MVGGRGTALQFLLIPALESPILGVQYIGHEDDYSGCTGFSAYFLILLNFPTLYLLVQLNQVFLTSFGEDSFGDPSENIGEGAVVFFQFEVWVRW